MGGCGSEYATSCEGGVGCVWVGIAICVGRVLAGNMLVVNCRGDDPVDLALGSSNLGTLALGPS